MILEKGQLVRSIAGHDIGEYFLVYQIIDDNFVLIVNGKTRKLEKPKLKKIKHLSKMNKKSDVIDSLDKNDLQSQNKKIRNVIFELFEVK